MIYLLKKNFKANTAVYKALEKQTGIGRKMSIQTLDQLGIAQNVKLQDLSASQYTKLNQIVHQNFLTESEYHILIKKRIKRLNLISSYRGFRHFYGLPCRGQRTHTNARTAKKLCYKL